MNTENESRKLEAGGQLGPTIDGHLGAGGYTARPSCKSCRCHLLCQQPGKHAGTLSLLLHILKMHPICFRVGQRKKRNFGNVRGQNIMETKVFTGKKGETAPKMGSQTFRQRAR